MSENTQTTNEQLDRLLTVSQVADIVSVSIRTLWRMVQRKQFPQPIRYNRKLVRWKATAVAEYIRTMN